MKTLVVYDDEGNVIFTLKNITGKYDLLIENINNDKQVTKVDVENKICILEDNDKIKKLKKQIENAQQQGLKNINNSKNDILSAEANLVELEYQKLLLNR